MNEKRTFKLEELHQEFWQKVIFFEIQHSSGMGGSGCLWLITSDVKLYFIDFDGFPYEGKPGEFHPLLGSEFRDGEVLYQAERQGFKRYENHLTFVKEQYYEEFKKAYYNIWHKNVGRIHYVHMPDVMVQALGVSKIERFDYEVSVQKGKEFEELIDRCDREHEKRKLSEKYFEWLPLYENNIPSFSTGEIGWYCMLLKEVKGKVAGHRFTILYQHEEIEPLHRFMNAKIEKYILLERTYDDVIGNLRYPDFTKDIKDSYVHTLDSMDLNSHGEFIRAFDTIEGAKNYAIEVANKRNYANTDNIITGSNLDNHRLIKESLKRRYKGIIMLREYAPKIIEFISHYEFPAKSCAGGGYYIPDMVEELGIDKDELIEMLPYLPIRALLPRTQRKAEAIIKEVCK